MAKDITIHFVGNARDLARASAEAEAAVDRVGNAALLSGAKAAISSVGFGMLLAPVVALSAALLGLAVPVAFLGGTFLALGVGVVALAEHYNNWAEAAGNVTKAQKALTTATESQEGAIEALRLAELTYEAKPTAVNLQRLKDAQEQATESTKKMTDAQTALTEATAHADNPWTNLMTHLNQMALTLGEKATPMAGQLLTMFDKLIPAVTALGLQLIDWFGARLPTLLPIVTEVLHVGTAAVTAFFQAWGRLVDWFMAHWGQYTAAIMAVFNAVGTGVHFALPLLGLVLEAFQRLGPVLQLIRDHADSLRPLLIAVGVLFVAMAASVMLTVAAVLLVVGAITAVAAAMSFAVTHINAVADAFWAVVHAVESAISAIGRVKDAIGSIPVIGGIAAALRIPGAAEGGIVPGPYIGAPQLILAHAGEMITPPGRSSAGAVYNINVGVSPLASLAETGRAVVAAIQEYERRSGTAWRS